MIQAEYNMLKRDAARERGSGLSDLAAGIRLRYEIKREFAPYVGIERSNKYGGSADFARAEAFGFFRPFESIHSRSGSKALRGNFVAAGEFSFVFDFYRVHSKHDTLRAEKFRSLCDDVGVADGKGIYAHLFCARKQDLPNVFDG